MRGRAAHNLSMSLARTLLASRGIFYIVTRFAPSRLAGLRRLALEANYQSGKWLFLRNSAQPEMVALVETYAKRGRILDVGCGTGALAAAISPERYFHYHGIDLTKAGIDYAKQRRLFHATFELADIHRFQDLQQYDLIVFEETLYYVNPLKRRTLLRTYASMLADGGTILVTLADPNRFESLMNMIKHDYAVIEDRPFQNSRRRLLVFTRRPES